MLQCSQPWWEGAMSFTSPSSPCFSSGLGTAGRQFDTRHWQCVGVCGERMCSACSGHQVIRVSNIRCLMSTRLPLRPRESKGQLQRVTHPTKSASCTLSHPLEKPLSRTESGRMRWYTKLMGRGAATAVSASDGCRGWGSFQVAVRDPLPRRPSSLVTPSAHYIQQEEKVMFFNSESHLMCFRGLL